VARCRHCGHEEVEKAPDGASLSNNPATVQLDVRTDLLPVLESALRDIINTFVMHGKYHASRALKPLHQQVRDQNLDFAKSFRAECWAQIIAGHDAGFEIELQFDPERNEVLARGISPEGKDIVLGRATVRNGIDYRNMIDGVMDFLDRREREEPAVAFHRGDGPR